ncbi:MAG: hypothetical protein ACI9SG_001264 [Maribacter sp.]|jgi:hypothetical protein
MYYVGFEIFEARYSGSNPPLHPKQIKKLKI